MIGISSLDLLAFPVRHGARPIIAIVDARKDEVFWSVYLPVPGGVQRIGDPAVGSIDEVVADVVARRLDPLFVGDGALRHRDRLVADAGGEVADQFLSHPSAAPLVQLAHAQALREEWVNPWEIQPLYLRLPDAQINWATRASARRVGAPEQP
jgi:tRNA threonylcarbamoyladenosine biosynthesis protein TsaB